MTHQYKTSYKTYRNVNRFHVDLPYPNGDPLPDSEYWENQANQRLIELMDIVGDEQARVMTAHITGTWHEVHDAIKVLVKAQAQSDPAELDGTEPSPYILGGKIFSPAFVSAHDLIELPF
jgi:hypothetical protein